MPIQKARSAGSIQKFVGVVSHFDYHGTPYQANAEVVKNRLKELGVKVHRSGVRVGSQAYYDHLNDLAASGIKLISPIKMTTPMSEVSTFHANVANALKYLEGVNEWDSNWPNDPDTTSFTWDEQLRAKQNQLFDYVQITPALSHLTVLAPAIAGSGAEHTQAGSMVTNCDLGNMHNYPGGNNPGAYNKGIQIHLDYAASVSGTKKVYATEYGYHAASLSATSPYTPEDIQGKYDVRAIFEHMLNPKVEAMCFYELSDTDSTNETLRNYRWGLIKSDALATPKPSFTGIKNTISILKEENAPTFETGSLDYTVSGGNADVKTYVLQKSDGRFYLAVWYEIPEWDPDTKSVISPLSANPVITVTLNNLKISVANRYVPNYSDAIQNALTVTDGNSFKVEAARRLTLVELVPVAKSATLNMPANGGTFVAGQNSIVLKVATTGINIAKVTYFDGGVPIDRPGQNPVTASPWELTITFNIAGTKVITAQVEDLNGTVYTTPNSSTITITKATATETAKITAPAAGATVPQGTTVTSTVDTDKTVTGVYYERTDVAFYQISDGTVIKSPGVSYKVQ